MPSYMSSKTNRYRILTIVLATLLTLSLLSQCAGPAEDYPRDESPRFTETWSSGQGTNKVIRIPLIGIIMRSTQEGLFQTPDMVEEVLAQIQSATQDPAVKAILLDVNSPGGGVTPSDEIYHALQRFKTSDPSRKIVVFFRDLGASGSYYAAMAGDLLIAEPTAVIGSIGVIMQSINMQGLAEKIGLTDVTIKSGENKDLLNPFQQPKPQQLKILQTLIDGMQTRFVNIVTTSRNLSREETPTLFDGRIFSATEAQTNGLIDNIGYWNDALVQTELLLGLGPLHVVRYETEKGFFELLMTAKAPSLPSMRSLTSSQFLYLWRP